MEEINYIYQCVAQVLALEEAGIASRQTRLSSLRYIRNQFEKLIPEYARKESDARAQRTVKAVMDMR